MSQKAGYDRACLTSVCSWRGSLQSTSFVSRCLLDLFVAETTSLVLRAANPLDVLEKL